MAATYVTSSNDTLFKDRWHDYQFVSHWYVPPSALRVCILKRLRLVDCFSFLQMKLVMFTLLFCSSAECSTPASIAPRRRRQRPGHRPGHHDQVRSTHSERHRGQQLRHHDQVPATHKERLFGQQPWHHNQVPVTNNCRGQPPSHHDQLLAWRRGYRPGNRD